MGGEYSIEKMEDIIYIKINVRKTENQPLPGFANDISRILEQNKGKQVLIDTSDFPEEGTPNNSDWSKSRYTTLIRLMGENPNLSIKSSHEIFELYKSMLNGAVYGTAERFYLRPKQD